MTSTPTPSAGIADARTAPTVTRRAAVALSIGTVVEWFDFALYGFSAAALAAAFFPKGDAAAAVLATLAIYGVSFLGRPIGGIVFGRIGDRFGRRTALLTSILIMGIATAGIGLIPSFGTIGVFAPVLLVLARLIQGFAASSELTGAQTYMLEAAPPGRRGLWVNAVGSLGSVGTAAATLLVLVFHLLPGDYATTGWRWPFLVGGAVAILGMLLRLRLAETGVFTELRDSGAQAPPLREVLRRHGRQMLYLVAFFAVAGIGFQTLVGFMPTYMTSVAKLSATTALLISLGTFLFAAVVVVLFGALSDRVGRKPLLIGGSAGIIVLSVPAYLLIGTGSLLWMILAQALLVLPLQSFQAAGNVANAEIFPASVRYSATALSYTFTYAVFAGTAPLLDDVLFHSWGHLGPAWYAVLIGLLALPVFVKGYPESLRYSLRDGAPEPAAARTTEPALRKDTV